MACDAPMACDVLWFPQAAEGQCASPSFLGLSPASRRHLQQAAPAAASPAPAPAPSPAPAPAVASPNHCRDLACAPQPPLPRAIGHPPPQQQQQQQLFQHEQQHQHQHQHQQQLFQREPAFGPASSSLPQHLQQQQQQQRWRPEDEGGRRSLAPLPLPSECNLDFWAAPIEVYEVRWVAGEDERRERGREEGKRGEKMRFAGWRGGEGRMDSLAPPHPPPAHVQTAPSCCPSLNILAGLPFPQGGCGLPGVVSGLPSVRPQEAAAGGGQDKLRGECGNTFE
jgi:hypothetical protein